MLKTSLQQMLYFMAAADCLNFTKAAEQMYVAQPAFSKSIAKLEESLGVKLFQRVYHGVELTPAGHFLYGEWRDHIPPIRQSLEVVQSFWGPHQRRLKLGCLLTFQSDPLMIECISRYRLEKPDTELSFEFLGHKELSAALHSHEIDLAAGFSYSLCGLDGIQTVKIRKLPVYFSIRATHPLANKPGLSLADLKDDTFCLIPPWESRPSYDNVIELCREHGFTPKNIQYDNGIASREAAIRLGCVGIGSAWRTSDIRSFLIDDHISNLYLTLAWNDGAYSDEIQKFSTLLFSLSDQFPSISEHHIPTTHP